MWHYFGSLGVSEASAESVASLLKKFSGIAGLSTQRVIEKTILQHSGLEGDGTDDSFILRVWARQGRTLFLYKHARRRTKQFGMGRGSKTLHRYFVEAKRRKQQK